MKAPEASNLMRYARQVQFAPLGLEGQKRLARARALVVGVGGLGSWAAELLSRAGVGFLRLADGDRVELANLHRQGLYDEADAAAGGPKVFAAADRIRRLNREVAVEPVAQRLDRSNVDALAGDVDLVLDGTDNFATRFLLNDWAVKHGRPWIFAGVLGAEAQVLPILPGRTPCLRCLYESPPPPCVDPTCQGMGVLGPAVAAVAAIEALEAIKVLSGRLEAVSPYLLKMDLWNNALQRIDAASACRTVDCPCCKRKDFEFLEP